MQSRCFALLAACLLGVSNYAVRADPFRNLDFDEGSTSGVFYDAASGLNIGRTADLLPGWQVITGLFDLEYLAVDPLPFDSQRISLVDYNPTPFWDIVPSHMGKFGLVVAPRGTNVFNFADTTVVSLVQRGQVPANATGLIVRGSLAGVVWNWRVTMDGVSLPAVWSVAGIIVDSLGDFAGKDVELAIELSGGVRGRLDDIQFLPEPRDAVLWGIGLLIGGVWLISRQRPRARTAANATT